MKYSIVTEGMGCGHCIMRVTKAMNALGLDIGKVELNDVVVSGDKTAEEIAEAIEKLGFKVKKITAE